MNSVRVLIIYSPETLEGRRWSKDEERRRKMGIRAGLTKEKGVGFWRIFGGRIGLRIWRRKEEYQGGG